MARTAVQRAIDRVTGVSRTAGAPKGTRVRGTARRVSNMLRTAMKRKSRGGQGG